MLSFVVGNERRLGSLRLLHWAWEDVAPDQHEVPAVDLPTRSVACGRSCSAAIFSMLFFSESDATGIQHVRHWVDIVAISETQLLACLLRNPADSISSHLFLGMVGRWGPSSDNASNSKTSCSIRDLKPRVHQVHQVHPYMFLQFASVFKVAHLFCRGLAIESARVLDDLCWYHKIHHTHQNTNEYKWGHDAARESMATICNA